jgi:hypothetical protein
MVLPLGSVKWHGFHAKSHENLSLGSEVLGTTDINIEMA